VNPSLPFSSGDAILAQYMLWPCVCLSVCLSQVGVLPKRLNTGSRKQRLTTAKDSSFLQPNILLKFHWRCSQLDAIYRWARLKWVIFYQYISETLRSTC